jgi:hypothetical protein
MKVLLVNGSPNKNGCTNEALRMHLRKGISLVKRITGQQCRSMRTKHMMPTKSLWN